MNNTFTGVSVMLGAVTETDSLRKTVKTVIDLCDDSDLTEIIISYPERITPQCKATVDELVNAQLGVPIKAFMQTRPFIGAICDMIDAVTGSHCLLLSSDMALDLDCVPKMIEHAKQEPDVIVKCSRWLPDCKFYDYGTLAKAANRLAQGYLRVLYRSKLTDFTIPVQIAPSQVCKSIKFERTDFALLLEIVLKLLRLGYRFVELPTNCYPRTDGKSSNSLRQIPKYLKTSIHVRFMKKQDILK